MTATSPQQRFWIRWLRFYRTNPYFQARWGLGTILILLLFILLAVTATNTIVFGAPTSFSPEDLQNNENKIATCDNTQQGRIFVTDDKGNVCKWKHVDPLTKCCTELYDSKARAFSCENCNISTSCCSVYEFCVSCCMDPAKEDLRNEISEFVSEKSVLKTATNSFQFCRAICRTSSRSIHSHNRYRDEYKHCYTLESPPINNETNPLDSRKSHESELEANEDDTSGKDKLKDKHKDKLKDELKKTVLPTETSTGSVADALEVEVNETKKEEVKEFTEVEGLVAMDTNMNNNNKWEFGAARTFSSGHSLAQEVAHHLRLVLLIILFLFTCAPQGVKRD